jgi:demethylmenaquinone methyltransferase/2-methoxy-6-polyprenyl-1,4-benzoquinol methylase
MDPHGETAGPPPWNIKVIPMIPPEQSKKVFVRRMFNDIAAKYDLLNSILSFGQDNRWRKKAVADIPAHGLVIDLCAGGGEMAREILSRKNFRGEVIMTDISPNMLLLIKRNMPPIYEGRYHIVICDVENLPFKAGSFSGAVSAFCLRNLSDLKTFTNEVRRVMAAGGPVRHLEIGHPKGRLLTDAFEFYFFRLSPLIARIFTSKSYAYRYLPASLKSFPGQVEVEKLLGHDWKAACHKDILGGIASIYSLEKGEN